METFIELRDQLKEHHIPDTIDKLLSDIEREFRSVVRDRQKLEEENNDLKAQIKPKKVKSVRTRCPCMTAKGTQCRKFCVEGGDTCKVHSKPLKPVHHDISIVLYEPHIKRQCFLGTSVYS